MRTDRATDTVESQAAFYDAMHKDAIAQENLSAPARMWRFLRWRLQAYNRGLGVIESINEQHRTWLGDLTDRSVLDLGCYSGNPLSVSLAEQARSYVGIDLSETAIAELGAKLTHCEHAKCLAGDVFAAGFAEGQFDVVYARGVLHHFEDPERILREAARLLSPGGMVISYDPLRTEPVNAVARAVYRPFQDDAAWEWPFSREFFRLAARHFEIEAIRGYSGLSRLGLPLSVISTPLALKVGRWGDQLDQRHSSRLGWGLWNCWNVALKLTKLP